VSKQHLSLSLSLFLSLSLSHPFTPHLSAVFCSAAFVFMNVLYNTVG
jgi:hypothetical protein